MSVSVSVADVVAAGDIDNAAAAVVADIVDTAGVDATAVVVDIAADGELHWNGVAVHAAVAVQAAVTVWDGPADQ